MDSKKLEKLAEKNKNVYPLCGSMFLRQIKQFCGRILIPMLPINRHVFNHLRWETNAIWVRVNNRINPWYIFNRIKKMRGENLSVNVACGPFGKEGWINLDLMNLKNVTLRYDCRKSLPLRKDSVLRIRCEQFLEHLDFEEEAPLFLRSCLRSLKKGGVLRIIVPDAERYLLAYQSARKKDWLNLGWDLDKLPTGFTTQMDIINHVFRQCEEHMYAYDFETLSTLLKKIGFSKIIKSEWGKSVDPELCDDLTNHKPDSLYVEATK